MTTIRVARLGGLLCLALSLCAGLICFSSLRRLDGGDAVIPVLCSREHYEWFFWCQARFGMLVPLLTSPVQNLLVNYYVQNYLTAFGFLASGFLLARGSGGSSTLCLGWLTVVLTLLAWSDEVIWSLTTAQLPFGISVALLGWICILARTDRVGWLFLAAVLCFWVNSALFPVAAVLIVPGRRRYLSLIIAFLAITIWSRNSPFFEGSVEAIRWPTLSAAAQGAGSLARNCQWMLLPLCLGLAKSPSQASFRMLIAAGVVLAEFLLLGWVEANQFHIRYFSVGCLLISAALAEPMARKLSSKSGAAALLATVAVILLLVRFRPEPPAHLLGYWIQQSGQRVQLARRWGARFIGPEFDSSWKAVFLSRLLSGGRIDAVAARSYSLRSTISPLLLAGQPVLAEAKGWLELQRQASSLGIPLTSADWTTLRLSDGYLLCAHRAQKDPPALQGAEICPWDRQLTSRACWPFLGHGFNERDGEKIATIGRSAEICLQLPGPSARLVLDFASRDLEQVQILLVRYGGREWNIEIPPGRQARMAIPLVGVAPAVPLRFRIELPKARRIGTDWPLFALNLEGLRVDSVR